MSAAKWELSTYQDTELTLPPHNTQFTSRPRLGLTTQIQTFATARTSKANAAKAALVRVRGLGRRPGREQITY